MKCSYCDKDGAARSAVFGVICEKCRYEQARTETNYNHFVDENEGFLDEQVA